MAIATFIILAYGCTHTQPAATHLPASSAYGVLAASPSVAPKPYTTDDVMNFIRLQMTSADDSCDGEWIKSLQVQPTGVPDQFQFTCEDYTLGEGDGNPMCTDVKGTCNLRTHNLHITSMKDDDSGGCYGLHRTAASEDGRTSGIR